MDLSTSLFVLRVISAGLLLALLMAIALFLWRDLRSTANQMENERRVYGYLIAMQEHEGTLLPTGDLHPLLPMTSLGRSPTNTIVITDSTASSEHALLLRKQGQWWLEDRRSRNGTTLNWVPTTEPVIVTNGDVIGIGSMFFRIELN